MLHVQLERESVRIWCLCTLTAPRHNRLLPFGLLPCSATLEIMPNTMVLDLSVEEACAALQGIIPAECPTQLPAHTATPLIASVDAQDGRGSCPKSVGAMLLCGS